MQQCVSIACIQPRIIQEFRFITLFREHLGGRKHQHQNRVA